MPDDLKLDFRPVDSKAEWEALYRLTHDCYVKMGLCQPRTDGMFLHYQGFDRLVETQVIGAYHKGALVGSFTITRDGPNGLPFQEDFRKECAAVREEPRRLAAIWRFIVSGSSSSLAFAGTPILREALRRLAATPVNTLLAVVNRGHESAYTFLFKAAVLAVSDHTRDFPQVPVQLLRIDAENIPPRWQTR